MAGAQDGFRRGSDAQAEAGSFRSGRFSSRVHLICDRVENREFTVTLDITEAMGMETMVYFTVDGQEVCGRVDPGSAAGPGEPMKLYANMDRMHLIDPATNLVI